MTLTVSRLAADVSQTLGLGPAGVAASAPTVAPADLTELAARHGVLAALSDAWPGEVLAQRSAARADVVSAHLRAVHALRVSSSALAAAGVPWVVVKGPAVAAQFYPRPDLRPFGDLDLLVAPRALPRALDALMSAGASMPVRNWRLVLDRGLGELPLLMPDGTTIDLHWHLVNRRALRQGLALDTDELLARSVPLSALGADVATLNPADTMVHLGWHAAMAGCSRLIWAADLALATLRSPVEPDELADRCRRTRTTDAVAVALDWVAVAFPAGGARSFAAALPGSAWRDLARTLVTRRLARRPGRRGGQLVPRSTRTGSARSAGAAARQVVRDVARLAGAAEPAERTSLMVQAGGASERDTYLARVTGGTI